MSSSHVAVADRSGTAAGTVRHRRVDDLHIAVAIGLGVDSTVAGGRRWRRGSRQRHRRDVLFDGANVSCRATAVAALEIADDSSNSATFSGTLCGTNWASHSKYKQFVDLASVTFAPARST